MQVREEVGLLAEHGPQDAAGEADGHGGVAGDGSAQLGSYTWLVGALA